MLNDRNFPSIDVKLLDDDESLGKLESVGDEVTFIQNVRTEQFQNIDFTFFASDAESTRKNWKTARNAGSAIIDLSSALEDEPDAAVRSPWIERQLGHPLIPELQPGPAVVAHPAAVVLALLLLRVQKAGTSEAGSGHGVRACIRTRSERHGRTARADGEPALVPAIAEEHFRYPGSLQHGSPLRRAFGAGAWQRSKSRVLRHYQKIAGKDAPLPSVLLVQAPIFHGHAFAIHVELGQTADVESISRALAGEHVKLTLGADDAPSNVNAAGQVDIQVSIAPDASQPNSFWLWAASDNLRIAAATAVECAETMAATRPRGKIQ